MNIVTFIIPTIGRDSLKTALNSLYNQSMPNWKAIVIFDGIEPNIVPNDSRIKIITTGNKLGISENVNGENKTNGAGYVRNYGIQLCDTEWIAFLDDDDTIAYNYLETFYNEIHLIYDADVIIFRMKHPEYGVLPKLNSTNFIKYEVGISFAIKTKIFQEDKNTFKASHSEDYTLLNELRDKNYRIVLSPYVKYFVNNNSHCDIYHEKGRRFIVKNT